MLGPTASHLLEDNLSPVVSSFAVSLLPSGRVIPGHSILTWGNISHLKIPSLDPKESSGYCPLLTCSYRTAPQELLDLLWTLALPHLPFSCSHTLIRPSPLWPHWNCFRQGHQAPSSGQIQPSSSQISFYSFHQLFGKTDHSHLPETILLSSNSPPSPGVPPDPQLLLLFSLISKCWSSLVFAPSYFPSPSDFM